MSAQTETRPRAAEADTPIVPSRFLLAALAYIIPTFPLGYFWHLEIFRHTYASLAVYRPDITIPLGVASMLIQGLIWAYLYWRLFRHETVIAGAVKFAAIAAPLAWSFMVVAVAAKHHMTSVSGFLQIETAFIAVQYLVVSPLIALAFSYRSPTAPSRALAN
jgi:hypothetical protein